MIQKNGALFAIFALVMVFCTAASVCAEERKFHFKVDYKEAASFTSQIVIHGRTKIAMLFMPETEMFLKLTASGKMEVAPANQQGLSFSRWETATASLEYYTPGQPNQEIPMEVVDKLLWTSGLGASGSKIDSLRDKQGNIKEVSGVEKEYQDYFLHDLLYFPDREIGLGEVWENTFKQPVSIDLNSPPVYGQVKAKYTLDSVNEASGIADISFEMGFATDAIMQNGNKVNADLKVKRSGILRIRTSDGFPLSSKSVSNTEIKYSDNNYIISEEKLEASSQLN
jgi:hypothetical protein